MIGISDLEYLCTEVRQIARKAGAFLRDERQKFDRERVEEKSAHNYVSYVDKESERRLVEQLSALLPGAGFIAEEGSGSLTDEDYCWVIDPLDGTSNYIHDMAPYSVSIALRNKEELLLGVVYEVCRNECFYAWKGSKAYLDGKEIKPEDLAGKSGKVKIRFDYTNNESRTVNIDGKDLGVKVPFLAASVLMLPGDKFKNVKVSGGKVMADQDQSIVIGTAFPGLADSLELKDYEATKDIDLVLIVEALTAEFGETFWEFIKEAE